MFNQSSEDALRAHIEEFHPDELDTYEAELGMILENIQRPETLDNFDLSYFLNKQEDSQNDE